MTGHRCLYLARGIESYDSNSVGMATFEDRCCFERFAAPHENLRRLSHLTSGHLDFVRMQGQADDVVVMAEKEALLVLLEVVDDADSGDKVAQLVELVVEEVGADLVASIAVDPLQSQLGFRCNAIAHFEALPTQCSRVSFNLLGAVSNYQSIRSGKL